MLKPAMGRPATIAITHVGLIIIAAAVAGCISARPEKLPIGRALAHGGHSEGAP